MPVVASGDSRMGRWGHSGSWLGSGTHTLVGLAKGNRVQWEEGEAEQ